MPEVDLPGLLQLETIETNIYRAGVVFAEQFSLYGGQVAAQALMAAGLTVEPDRVPHSLHGYFLRAGDPTRPTVFRVDRDRDGRSFSARRVVAIQDGDVIFSMAGSFHVERESPAQQADQMPVVDAPDRCEPLTLPRLFSITSRVPAQPLAGLASWPTLFWSRVDPPLVVGGPASQALVHACALTYLSDISTGVLPLGSALPGPSLDHAVWFHDLVDMNDWVLSDYQPRVAGRGRGWYTGSIFTQDGRLVASIAQECLFGIPAARARGPVADPG